MRADGRGRVLDAAAPEAARAIELLRERYPQQRATGAVLAVDVAALVGLGGGRRLTAQTTSAPASDNARSASAESAVVDAPDRIA